MIDVNDKILETDKSDLNLLLIRSQTRKTRNLKKNFSFINFLIKTADKNCYMAYFFLYWQINKYTGRNIRARRYLMEYILSFFLTIILFTFYLKY